MERYFEKRNTEVFVLFSIEHLITLLVLIILAFLIFILRKRLRLSRYDDLSRCFLFFILILSEIGLHLWLYDIGSWQLKYSLPLHLSSISLLLSAFALLFRSFFLFELTYFIGVGSALQAMITPDISFYTFPHFRYVHFFISHGATVLANLYLVFVTGFKPTLRSLWKAFIVLNIYTGIIFILNLAIGSNYMYISKKPVNPSMLDYLGPWPFYILPLEFIALGTFFILYLPFWLIFRRK